MNFTPGARIQKETEPVPFVYDDGRQVTEYDMAHRQVGTYSLKTPYTEKKHQIDRKNEIDDAKWVD
jgi:hypothetical protein